MKILIYFLSILSSLGVGDIKSQLPGSLTKIQDTNIVVNIDSQTIQGPTALAALIADISAFGLSNNITITWSYLSGPANLTFNNTTGRTNLLAFNTQGIYNLLVEGAIGKLYNNKEFQIFVTDQGIDNFLPTISILFPSNGSEFIAPIDLLINAYAQDKDGTIEEVIFYNGSNVLGTSTVAPYTIILTNAAEGNYVFAASVRDNKNATNLSTASSVIVRSPAVIIKTPPLVAFANFTSGETLIAPITFDLEVDATDSDGTIVTVLFTDNDIPIVIDVEAPYLCTITPSVGEHIVRVIVTDNDGLQSIASVSFTVINPPNILPIATLVSPINGAVYTSPATVILNATATDSDGTISYIRFFNNNIQVGLDTNSPYSITLSNLVVGSYSFYAEAIDNITAVGISSTNIVTVQPPIGLPPLVTITFPTNNTIIFTNTPITITVNASDSDGTITNVGFYHVTLEQPEPEFPPTIATETLIGNDTSFPYSHTWIPSSANSYLLVAKAYDNSGLITISSPPVTLNVNPPIPPFVQLTFPTNGMTFMQSSNITLTANATDQDGTITNVHFMQFQPNVFITNDITSPYSGVWNNIPSGSYSLVAKAFDNNGLTTISTAISITIIPTVAQSVVIDAGPSKTAQLSPYKQYFDIEQGINGGSFTSQAIGATGPIMYNMQYVIDAAVSMYEGTKETNYINRALTWCQQAIANATIVDNDGKKNWSGTWASPYISTPIAYQLEEFQGSAALTRCARVIMSEPDLRIVYGVRATTIYNFVRDHIVNKNIITRNAYTSYPNWSRNTTSPTSDKPPLLLRNLLDLRFISGILGNTDTSDYSWSSKISELAEGIKDYNGAENRFLPWPQPVQLGKALVWAHNKKWQSYTDLDTSHANRLPFVVVQCYEMGQTFTLNYITGLSDLLTKVLWDGSTTSPRVKNFLDGSNGAFLNRPAWNNGRTYDGFYMLAGYSTEALNFAKYTALAVKNGVSNPSLSYQNSTYGRTAMSGNLARAVAMRETAPYAILNGTVSGTGTTATNWTHISGPSGFTIVKPNNPITTLLFTNSAVGNHTFRLTVSTTTGSVSDDVNVTVMAMPAYGSIITTNPPPPPPAPTPSGSNIFQKRFIFYHGSLSTTAQKDRIINIIRRGAAVGYNGIVVREGGSLSALNPNSTTTNNFNLVRIEAEGLGMLFIPYSFSYSEPVSTAPLELREAFPVTDTKFIRSGSSATAVGDPSPVMINGGFETYTGNSPGSWSVDAPGVITFIDTAIKRSGNASVRFTNPNQNPPNYHARSFQYITVSPFRAYKIEAWVKTQAFTSPDKIKFYVIGQSNGRLLWTNRDSGLGVDISGTQDWTRFEIDINSLENSQIILYVMCSGNATGSVWFDDVALTEVGLYSTVRRSSTPVVVENYAGSPTYTEGADYTVGNQILTIPGGSTIPAGASLKVSWYQLADMAERFTVPATACSPEFFNVLTTNAANISARLNVPSGWMMRYNEWRVGNWDPSCGNITMGFYLSNVVAKTETIINNINPSIEKYIWNDMFDPYHNALPLYMMDKGTLIGAWTGISTNTIIMNWYNAGTINNLKFWSGINPTYPKGHHKQIIAGYYEGLSNVNTWLSLLKTAEQQGVTDVIGFMYTTWATGSDGGTGRYDDLEAVAQIIINSGRWGTGSAL